eukprot:3759505-Rhodomonas_salina.2
MLSSSEKATAWALVQFPLSAVRIRSPVGGEAAFSKSVSSSFTVSKSPCGLQVNSRTSGLAVKTQRTS